MRRKKLPPLSQKQIGVLCMVQRGKPYEGADENMHSRRGRNATLQSLAIRGLVMTALDRVTPAGNRELEKLMATK